MGNNLNSYQSIRGARRSRARQRINPRGARMLIGGSLALMLSACGAASSYNSGAMTTGANAYNQSAQSGSATITLAERLSSQGNHQGAAKLYRQVLKNGSNSTRARLGLGKALMGMGDYGSAREILEIVVGGNPNHAAARAALGRVWLVLGETDAAQTHFRAAVNTGNAPASAYSGLAVTYELTAQHNSALGIFDDGISKYANDLDLLSNKALVMAINGQTEEAIGILSSVVIQPSARMGHRQNLALAYAFHGDSQRALRMASIDMDPDSARRTVATFYTLNSLDQDNRMRALLYGLSAPRSDLEQPANEVERETDGSPAAERVIGVKEPEPMPEPEPEPEPVEMPDLPPLMEAEGWSVQIAAYRTREEIINGWKMLSEQYFDIIGHLEPRRSEVDFGPRGEAGPQGFYYRLNAGPLKNFEESKAICDTIIAAGGDCWIRPPEPAEGRLPK